MIQFDADYIDKVNATYTGGKFLKCLVVTEDLVGPVIKRWVDHEVAITFQSQTYYPLHQRWENLKTSQSMPIEGASVSVSNLGDQARRYLKDIDISGNPITLQLLHLDLLSTLTNHWTRRLKVLGFQADHLTATFTVGRQLGKNKLPRKVFLIGVFPGLSSESPRIF